MPDWVWWVILGVVYIGILIAMYHSAEKERVAEELENKKADARKLKKYMESLLEPCDATDPNIPGYSRYCIAIPTYQEFVEKTANSLATSDIDLLEAEVKVASFDMEKGVQHIKSADGNVHTMDIVYMDNDVIRYVIDYDGIERACSPMAWYDATNITQGVEINRPHFRCLLLKVISTCNEVINRE